MNTPALAAEIVSRIRNSLSDSAINQETVVQNLIQQNLIEPKTGREMGVWFENEECWMYHGTRPVVLHFTKEASEFIEPIRVSRCPPCEHKTLTKHYAGRKVKRWLILPP